MEKNYKPYHILLFVLACLLVLGTIVWFIPSGKQKIGNYDFRFISENKLLKKSTRKKVDVASIIAEVDTTMTDNTTIEKKQETKKEKVKLLTYNKEGEEKLKHFFQELQKAKEKRVRILHYGDSQIEGDRLTAFLRQRLQDQFGGSGPGFMAIPNAYPSVTFEQFFSENFVRYTNYIGNPLVHSNNYGILNAVGRFTPEDSLYYSNEIPSLLKDSLHSDTLHKKKIPKIKEKQKSWIEFEPGKYAYQRAKKYNRIFLHYTDAFEKCSIKISKGENIVVEDSLISDGKYHVYPYTFEGEPEKIRYEFTSANSPIFLGFSLEGEKNGVLVDNIAMRGSSGTFFGRINQSLAKRMYDEQNVDLFIMQFGGNSVPHLKDSIAAKNIANNFKGQLNVIKRLRPNAAILVIGPSDMSTLIEGEYTTYPLLPYFIECLQKNTVEIGGIYYDLFAAMGGEDSMIAWVENELAVKDYVHFSVKGSKIAGQKFYDTFINKYNKLMTP